MTAGEGPRIALDRLVVLASSLVASAIVLTAYVRAAAPLELLWRPLAVAVAVALVIQLVLGRLLGWRRGAYWATVATAALGGLPVVAGLLVLVLTVATVFRGRMDEYRSAGIVAGGASLALVVVVALLGAASGAFNWSPLQLEPIDLELSGDGPSIHVLILDGYPRADTLLQEFDYDNAPFLDAMRERGFDVYEESHSNYDRTPFTLISMFSLQHLDEVDPLWESVPPTILAQQRVAARALLALPLFDALEQAGYHTRVITGPISSVPIGGAENTDSAGTANDFELTLIQRTLLARPLEMVGFAMEQQRLQIEETLERFSEPSAGPTFTVAHVMGPHPPFVFHADGSDASAPPCYPECDIFLGSYEAVGWTKDEYGARLAEQVQHVNTLVLQTVDRVIADDPEAVMVMMSDHGSRYDPQDDAEQFRNLLVARTPGHPDVLGDRPTLINVFPNVLNAYRGASIGIQTDTRFLGGHGPWLSIEEFRD